MRGDGRQLKFLGLGIFRAKIDPTTTVQLLSLLCFYLLLVIWITAFLVLSGWQLVGGFSRRGFSVSLSCRVARGISHASPRGRLDKTLGFIKNGLIKLGVSAL